MAELATIFIAIAIVIGCVCTTVIVFRVTGKSNTTTLKGAWGDKSIELSGKDTALPSVPLPVVALPSPAPDPRTDSDDEHTLPDNKPEKELGFKELFNAADYFDLDAAWSVLNSSVESKDIDFWTSFYLYKRVTLGGPASREQIISAHHDHADWVWPAIYLATIAVEQADEVTARTYLDEGMERVQSNNKSAIERLMSLELRHKGLDFAVTRARSFGTGRDEGIQAALIDGIVTAPSSNLKDTLTLQLMREIRQRAGRNLQQKFNLSYDYSKSPETYSLSLRHYAQLNETNYNSATVSNNLGVLYGHFGSSELQIDEYETAFKSGSVIAGINLVQKLVESGFLAKAEDLLNSIDQDEDAEINRASAISSLTKAKAEMLAKRSEIRESTLTTFTAFQAQISLISTFWFSGKDIIDGEYKASDANVSFDSVSCVAKMERDGLVQQGTFTRRGIFAEGILVEVGSSLLGGQRLRAVVAPISEDKLVMIAPQPGLGSTPKIWHLVRSLNA